jgi:hypothetical protein
MYGLVKRANNRFRGQYPTFAALKILHSLIDVQKTFSIHPDSKVSAGEKPLPPCLGPTTEASGVDFLVPATEIEELGADTAAVVKRKEVCSTTLWLCDATAKRLSATSRAALFMLEISSADSMKS